MVGGSSGNPASLRGTGIGLVFMFAGSSTSGSSLGSVCIVRPYAYTSEVYKPCEKHLTPKSLHFCQMSACFQSGQNFLKSLPSSKMLWTSSLHVAVSFGHMWCIYMFRIAYMQILRSWSSLSYAVRTREWIPHVLYSWLWKSWIIRLRMEVAILYKHMRWVIEDIWCDCLPGLNMSRRQFHCPVLGCLNIVFPHIIV